MKGVMLASPIKDFDKLRFPLYASPKLDGIRAFVENGVLLSRTLIPIPNESTQDFFGTDFLNGLDGELVVGEPNAKEVFQRTMSGVSSYEGDPNAVLYVFDSIFNGHMQFSHRHARLSEAFGKGVFARFSGHVQLLTQVLVHSIEELMAYHNRTLSLGFEGVMIRSVDGIYKHGRSTEKEGFLLKLKPFTDTETKVIGFVELCSNQNEATVDNLGKTKRSSAKAGKVPMDTLGALICENVIPKPDGVEKWPATFEIGSGFTAAQRKEIWENQDGYVGKVLKFKYQAAGTVQKPRTPIFLGWRAEFDL